MPNTELFSESPNTQPAIPQPTAQTQDQGLLAPQDSGASSGYTAPGTDVGGTLVLRLIGASGGSNSLVDVGWGQLAAYPEKKQ